MLAVTKGPNFAGLLCMMERDPVSRRLCFEKDPNKIDIVQKSGHV